MVNASERSIWQHVPNVFGQLLSLVRSAGCLSTDIKSHEHSSGRDHAAAQQAASRSPRLRTARCRMRER